MIREFQEFIAKGNVLDLAVAVVIGAAFSKIVDSFVKDILTPVLTPLTQGVDFAAYKLGPFAIGSFVNAVVQFIIVAFALFVIVKAYNRLHPKIEEAKVDLAAQNAEQNARMIELLEQIAGRPRAS